MLLHCIIDWLSVIDTVSDEAIYFSINLIQEITHQGRILFGSLGNFGSHNPTILVHSNMQLLRKRSAKHVRLSS